VLTALVGHFALPVLLFGTLARTPVAAALDPQRVPVRHCSPPAFSFMTVSALLRWLHVT